MSFSYSINTGLLGADEYYGQRGKVSALSYLDGIAKTNLQWSVTNWAQDYVHDHNQLEERWKGAFGDPLYFSQGIYFFENDGVDEMEKILSSQNDITFESNTNISRVDMYKEMFLQSYYDESVYQELGGTDTGIQSTVDFGTAYLNTAYDNNLGLNNAIIEKGVVDGYNLGAVDSDGDGISDDIEDLQVLYAQLEDEAQKLGDTLVDDSISFGGAPELPYSSLESEIYLLQKEMDRALNHYLHLLDDTENYFSGVYYNELTSIATLMTGGSLGDLDGDGTSDTDDDAALYKNWLATAASQMVGEMAIDYAQDYYDREDVAPSYQEFVYTNSYLNGWNDYSAHENNQQIQLYGKLNAYSFDSDGTLADFAAKEMDEIAYVPQPDSSFGWKGAALGDEVRDMFAVNGITMEIAGEDMNEIEHYLGEDIFAAAQELVKLKMAICEKTVVASINNEVRAEYEARLGAMAAINDIIQGYQGGCTEGIDPYLVNIGGVDYVMGKDSNDDGVINSIVEILGVNDTQDDLFKSVKELDTNNDGYVSQEEMLARNIIFNAVDANGQLSGGTYDTSKIQGIDLSTFEAADGTDNVFGTFKVDFASAQADGRQTFESKEYFNNLFGREVDFSVLDEQDTFDVVDSTEEAVVPESKEVSTEESEELAYNQDFSFNLVSTEESELEQMFEELCWERGIINISEAQKVTIIDSIDESQDLDIIEAVMQEKLDSINLSA